MAAGRISSSREAWQVWINSIMLSQLALSSPVIGTEFTAHSITSCACSPEWNAVNGPVMGAANPHLKYFEGNRYGYDVYELAS